MPKRHNSRNNDQRRDGRRKVPIVVKTFAEANWPTYKKEEKEYFKGEKKKKKKKLMLESYYEYLISSLPDVIEWLLRNSHIQDPLIQKTVIECYRQFSGDARKKEDDVSEGFVNYLTKNLRDYGLMIDNIELLPIILHEIIGDIIRSNEYLEETGEPKMDPPEHLFELSETILKSRLKKAKKFGIPEDVAFDLLGILPVKDAIKYGRWNRIMGIFNMIYTHANKIQTVDIEKIFKLVFDEETYPYVIEFALLEKKDRCRNFSEQQKKIFDDINIWLFNEMEEMNKSEIRDIIGRYINARKRAEGQGKDGTRRYYLSSLPSKNYPRVCSVIDSIREDDEENQLGKYL